MKTMVYRFFTPAEVEAANSTHTAASIIADIKANKLQAAFEEATQTYRINGLDLESYLFTIPHSLDLSYGV
jgi:hypothetical protein